MDACQSASAERDAGLVVVWLRDVISSACASKSLSSSVTSPPPVSADAPGWSCTLTAGSKETRLVLNCKCDTSPVSTGFCTRFATGLCLSPPYRWTVVPDG